ncbi:hypothetical protein PoB_000628100 [Plakobranchus ocellatus]|uniref:Uncharacterized protein n=1 Tax=Plakobranchus ocellatus TaxID=259542 RepID=A0AAV3XXU1_9GAST|nr:hypothetical protein PoB_000628100 [Plakobranchus ocellatus]
MLPLIRPNPITNNDRSILTAQSWFRIRRFPSGPKNINTMVERQRDMASSMGNRRRNRAVPSPDHHEENQAASSRNTVMMGNHITASINGGSHPRRQRFHYHQQAGPGPQYHTCNNSRCRHRHEGPHSTLQMSTQNCQIVSSCGTYSSFVTSLCSDVPKGTPNPGQPSAQRQHQRRHHQTFQKPRHNRKQSRARREQHYEVNTFLLWFLLDTLFYY